MKQLSADAVRQIVETHEWIKIRRYVDDPTLGYDERYARLEEHHRRETEFLIAFIRDLVSD